ncbi:MAG: hypothetical protein WDO56_35930 [Gammaproteobacteria bacterium]
MATKHRGQPIDLLVNNAGIVGSPPMKLIGELKPENAGRYLEYTNEELPW